MIIVIADDLTGASEIGGIGLRFNLTVEINNSVNEKCIADLQIINTNSRSVSKDEAVLKVKKVCEDLKKIKYNWVYIKTDSVLRGHVVVEVLTELQYLNLDKALLVPANPSLGRTIVNGKYFINDKLINETPFATDPEFPAISANLIDILKSDDLTINLVNKNNKALSALVNVAEVETEEDVSFWANQIEEKTLAVGAASFFKAILRKTHTQFIHQNRAQVELNYPVLYVCGSKFDKSIKVVNAAKEKGAKVSYILNDQNLNANQLNLLTEELSKNIKTFGKAILTIDQNTNSSADELREIMATIVNDVYEKTNILQELVIEGGATASSILDKIGIEKIAPVQEVSAGVIRNLAPKQKLIITLKPGSYSWSRDIWKF